MGCRTSKASARTRESQVGTFWRELTKDERELCKPFKYVCMEDKAFVVHLAEGGSKRATIKKGFLADGASGPGWDCIDRSGWWLHDWLYFTHKYDDGSECLQSDADNVFNVWWRRWAFAYEPITRFFAKKAWVSSAQPKYLPRYLHERDFFEATPILLEEDSEDAPMFDEESSVETVVDTKPSTEVDEVESIDVPETENVGPAKDALEPAEDALEPAKDAVETEESEESEESAGFEVDEPKLEIDEPIEVEEEIVVDAKKDEATDSIENLDSSQ